MSSYSLNWITKNIAAGRAPMSYDELDSIKAQGIDAIVNLCGEYSDLHELEQNAGFEVFWLPIPDESAPPMDELEKGLEWLDEAVYLGKKVLVHCRFGMGRTGTFITAYLLRRGYALKNAGKLLKPTSASPTNFTQWWLLRKFGKKEGPLKIGQPRPENRESIDLSSFFSRYEALLARVDALQEMSNNADRQKCCSTNSVAGCDGCFSLDLIEALYLNSKMNITLTKEQRQEVIAKATSNSESDERPAQPPHNQVAERCPLHHDDICLLHHFRPIRCRLRGYTCDPETIAAIKDDLNTLSMEIFEALFDSITDEAPPLVNFRDCISGKFIQNYFQFLMAKGKMDEN